MDEDKFKCGWCSRILGDDEFHGKDTDGENVCCYCFEEYELKR